MKIGSIIMQSTRSIWHNKGRSALTILGIVIGIAAVITLVALGNGLQKTVQSRVSTLGIKRITISSVDPNKQTAQRQKGRRGEGGFIFQQSNTETLSDADYNTIKNNPEIAQASPEVSTQLAVATQANAAQATQYRVFGIDSKYLSLKSWAMQTGSFISDAQVAGSNNVAVIGSTTASDLFPNEKTVVGQTIYIKDAPYTVIGVITQPDTNTQGMFRGGDPSENIYIGYKSWLALNGKDKMSSVIADAKSENTVDETAASIKNAILAAHKVSADKADVSTTTSKDLMSTMSSIMGGFTATLTGIAAISLVVGGIGIMNIMLVTVTERTREIGLRRAVGAKTAHILFQFLIESVILTVSGGIIGLGLGMVLSNYSSRFLSFAPGARDGAVQAVVDLPTVILAIAISVAVGVVFGLFPAIKASRKDPAEALRYE